METITLFLSGPQVKHLRQKCIDAGEEGQIEQMAQIILNEAIEREICES